MAEPKKTQQGRTRRELKTVRAMIGICCRAHHEPASGGLCQECLALWTYTEQRVERCPFGASKPTCKNCPVHCFKPDRREQIRQVMRFAGPRMLWRHPVLAILHVLDGRRPLPKPRRGRTTEREP